ncbi:type II toxin-antitoxin system ParD family antitoxin [Ochrobactrum sp. EDr1-4]|uniref:type II toxin-antitoxin system ParD family antitoxin n=1 Tax=unclassified Ochrobactrum TaxID=239106 RepID=UPI003BA06C50
MISAELGKTREGVRLIEDRETRLVALDALINRGNADADAGRTHAADDVFCELRNRYNSMLADKAE